MRNTADVAPLAHGAQGLSGLQFLLLLAAGLTVSMSYGVTLPLLPEIVRSFAFAGDAGTARHTGWLTAAYTGALLACSPAWGALSDRLERRWVIAAGLTGAGASLWALEQARSLTEVYAARVGAGIVAAAVLPAVLAYLVETTAPTRRQRRFAWMASATALGFLLGPVAGKAATVFGGRVSALQLVALVCVLIGAAAAVLPSAHQAAAASAAFVQPGPGKGAGRSMSQALLLTAVVVFGITVAEVGLTLLGGPVAAYFALCSAVMIGVQLGAYPLLERWLGEHRLVCAALAVMGAGIGVLAWRQPWTPAVAFLLAASALGVLIPALAVRISVAAGARQGWAMGRQAAAANLGQAAGAALTGVLFAAAAPAPFLLATLLLQFGAILAFQTAAPGPGHEPS